MRWRVVVRQPLVDPIARQWRRTARSSQARWQALGMTPGEAGNLAAMERQLRPSVASPWTPRQIEAVLFLRWLRETGRI